MLIARRFSVTNFFIASSALAFQVFVLYPWHKQLDEDFVDLKNEQLRIMKESQLQQAQGISELRAAIAKLEKDRQTHAR